jgi:hypothetical protein
VAVLTRAESRPGGSPSKHFPASAEESYWE